jgi:hypothetical protein
VGVKTKHPCAKLELALALEADAPRIKTEAAAAAANFLPSRFVARATVGSIGQPFREGDVMGPSRGRQLTVTIHQLTMPFATISRKNGSRRDAEHEELPVLLRFPFSGVKPGVAKQLRSVANATTSPPKITTTSDGSRSWDHQRPGARALRRRHHHRLGAAPGPFAWDA